MQIWNGSDEYCWRYRADTILSTEGQTDKVIPVYPFNFVEAGGITRISSYWLQAPFPCRVRNLVNTDVKKELIKYSINVIHCPLRKCSSLPAGSLIDWVSVVYVIGLPRRSVFNNGGSRGPFHWQFFHFSFWSHPDSNKVIIIKFCIWQDSYIIMACAKAWCDMTTIKGIATIHWIVMKKSVKWVPKVEIHSAEL